MQGVGPSRTRIAPLLVAATLLTSGSVHAAEPVPAQLAAQVQVKLLSYDKALSSRITGVLRVGIVSVDSHAESKRDGDAMMAAYETLAKTATVQGLKLEVVRIPLGADTQAALRQAAVGVAYVSTGLGARLAEVISAAKALTVPTLSRTRADCVEGLAVAVVPKDNRPAIVVNLRAAKATGMELSPSLLRLSEVLR